MEEVKQFEMVFMGQRVDGKGKRVYSWYDIEVKKERWFAKQIVPASVGGVYKFHGNSESVYTSGEKGPRYDRRYEDETTVKEWAIAEETARQQLSLKKLNTEAAKVEPLDDILKSIREISMGLNRVERRAFLAKISEAVLTW